MTPTCPAADAVCPAPVDPTLHYGLVVLIAQRYFRRGARLGMDPEDVMQAGYIGLMRAVKLFDPTRGFAFSTYLGSCVASAICAAFQKGEYRLRAGLTMVQLPDEYLLDDPHQPEPWQTIEDEPAAWLAQLLAFAPTVRHQELLRLRFGLGGGEGMTLLAIGEKWGVSQERIRQLEAEALRALRRRAQELGLVPG
jgi:RNA polymerase sigma factor (sigma-70 family)